MIHLLVKAGHEAWSTSQAGLSLDGDDELTVYAQAKRAALITHDKEFSQRREKNVVGQHIWLVCDEIDGPDLLAEHLNDLLPILAHHGDLFVRISPDAGYRLSFKWS